MATFSALDGGSKVTAVGAVVFDITLSDVGFVGGTGKRLGLLWLSARSVSGWLGVAGFGAIDREFDGGFWVGMESGLDGLAPGESPSTIGQWFANSFIGAVDWRDRGIDISGLFADGVGHRP